MFTRMSRRGMVVLLGMLALARCSGGNDVVGPNTGRAPSNATPTAVASTPVPSPRPSVRTPIPTPKGPCAAKFAGECGN